MAKTGDTPKGKPKARTSRPARPAFTPAAAPAASSAWVYRSDAAAPPEAKAVSPAAAPAVKPASSRRAAKPPVAAAPAQATAPAPAVRASRVTRAMDVVTLPIAVSLMAILAPVSWLLGPSRH
jgi:hypothetical protein